MPEPAKHPAAAPASPLPLRMSALHWLLPPTLYSLLALSLLFVDYNLFHYMMETGCVVIGIVALLVASLTRRFSSSSLLLVAASGLGWVALFDLLHTMSYEGMGLLPGSTANLATQFWLGGRLLQALVLLAAIILLPRRISLVLVHVACAAFTALLLTLIVRGSFPDTFVPGLGLTPFKIAAEYLIIALLLAAAVQVQRQRHRFSTGKFYGIQLALVAMVLSEFCFTLYEDVFDRFNEVGHLLKVFSYWFLFRALVEQTLLQPFQDRDRLLHVLAERLKELRCLNELARLAQLHEDDPQALLAAVAELLPTAMLHEQHARASIVSSFGNFGVPAQLLPPRRCLEVELQLEGLPVGTVRVGYPPGQNLPEPLFLDEE